VSAILGAVGRTAADLNRHLPRLLGSLSSRAALPGETWAANDAVLAAGALPWEADVTAWRGPLVQDCGRFVIAADACLFSVTDAAPEPGGGATEVGRTTADVVADLVARHDIRFAEFLDGDFAFAIWDKERHRLILARDQWGSRPIAFAATPGGALFSTSMATVVLHPDVPGTLDEDYLAFAAAHVTAPADRTPYARVRMVPAGSTIVLTREGAISRWHRRRVPAFEPALPHVPATTAAGDLRRLLMDAVARRLAPSPAAVWLSGGYDSPAVFAAAEAGRRTGVHHTELRPVSLSYPEGDVGREDHLIEAIASFWGVPIRWIHTRDIRLLAEAEERARQREDPLAHPFEPVQRALARAARDAGCRIVLDGNGGDQAFAGSIVARADALQSGRWGSLLRSYRRTRLGLRAFARPAILPLLGRDTRAWISAVRGRPLRGYWDETIPEWMVPRASLEQAAQAHVDPEPGESPSSYEARFLLTHPYLARVVSWVHTFGLEEGIILRSPLLDQRVIHFAARRPAEERFDGRSAKLLLRDSVRGLLPEKVLAPRPQKTGTPVDYVKREYHEGLLNLLRSRFAGSRRTLLAEIGVLEPGRLRSALETFEAKRDYQLGHRLYSTLQVEWWLAARS